MGVVVDKHSHIVGIGDGTVGDAGSGAGAVHVNTGSTERGVCEMTVVDGRTGTAQYLDTVLPQTGVVLWCIKLIIREREISKNSVDKYRDILKTGKQQTDLFKAKTLQIQGYCCHGSVLN